MYSSSVFASVKETPNGQKEKSINLSIMEGAVGRVSSISLIFQ